VRNRPAIATRSTRVKLSWFSFHGAAWFYAVLLPLRARTKLRTVPTDVDHAPMLPTGAGFAGRHSPASGKGFASRLPSSADCERMLIRGHPCALRAACSLFGSDLAATTVDLVTMVLVHPVPWERFSADAMEMGADRDGIRAIL
jgi:hypothetical protein